MKKVINGLVLFMLIASSFLFSCQNKNTNTDFLYQFEHASQYGVNIPIIKVKVGESNKYFIVDTGANMSMIDESYYLKHRDDFIFLKELDMTLSGINGGKDVNAAYIMAELGDSLKIKHQFITSDLKSVVNNIKSSCGVEIVGIIGADYLMKYEFSVDFKNNAVYRNVLPLDSIIRKEIVMK